MRFHKIKQVYRVIKKIYTTFKLSFLFVARKIYYGLYFSHIFRLLNNRFYGVFIPSSFFSRKGTFKLFHNHGFYSCYSLLLEGIIQCGKLRRTVTGIDTTRSFILFKDSGHEYDEIYYQFFQNQQKDINISQSNLKDIFKRINITKIHHHGHYKTLKFKEYTNLLNIYFSPSLEIQNRMHFF